MSIRQSSAADVIRLIAELTGGDSQRREMALARLAVIGQRATTPLLAVATNTQQPIEARVAAFEALEAIGDGRALSAAVVAAVAREDGERAPLATLKRAVEIVRSRQEQAPDAETREQWAVVRGVLHQHLAARGSRLALYDLREALESATTLLPVGFLSAAAVVGDTSCLMPLARAWVDSAAPDRWWRDHLAEAFGAIVAREQLTRRHAVLKQILERWPSAGVLVARAKR